MSDFKFACPGCGQRIAASDEHTGYQINCPACHAPIVVPANPEAPAAPPAPPSIAIATPPGMPPPPAPPKVTKLGIAASGAPQAHAPAPGGAPAPQMDGSAAYRAHALRQPKKSYSGLITAAVAVALIAGSAFLNKDWIAGKWKARHGASADEVAAQAATNAPPSEPPAPELTAAEVMEKVIAAYKDLPSFSSTGKMTSVMDMSAISPAAAAIGTQTNVFDLSLRMGKPLSFRIAVSTPAMQGGAAATGWSTGNGDFLQINNNSPVPTSTDDGVFMVFNLGASAGVGDIVRMFIDDPAGGFAKGGVEWTRKEDETNNGQLCYVLAGTVNLQNVTLWVSRSSFLIAQMQAVLDGKSGMAAMDDAQLRANFKAQNNGKEPTLAQFANFKKSFKVTGSVTASYNDIKTDLTLASRDFQPGASGPAQAQPGGRQPGAGAPGSRAAAIAGRRGRGN